MARNTNLALAQRNRALDAVAARLNTGYLRIYSGTRPTDADTALGAQVLLAQLRWNATAFAAASGGSASANPITSDTNAPATGTATWARFLESDGATVVMDVDVGTTGENLNLNTTSIVAGATVACSGYTLTMPQVGT